MAQGCGSGTAGNTDGPGVKVGKMVIGGSGWTSIKLLLPGPADWPPPIPDDGGVAKLAGPLPGPPTKLCEMKAKPPPAGTSAASATEPLCKSPASAAAAGKPASGAAAAGAAAGAAAAGAAPGAAAGARVVRLTLRHTVGTRMHSPCTQYTRPRSCIWSLQPARVTLRQTLPGPKCISLMRG